MKNHIIKDFKILASDLVNLPPEGHAIRVSTYLKYISSKL